MDSFIKKIFNKKSDNFVHLQFQKFSKGFYKNKALIKASKSNKGYSINTSSEYANELVRNVAELMNENQKVKVTGIIVSTRNLKEVPEFNILLAHVEVKQFMGVKQFKIDHQMDKKEILKICDLLPTSFIGLSFNVGETELKIKPKSPKSSKPSTKSGEQPKVDFCKLKTNNESLVRNLIFDIPDFKKLEISHDFEITGLEIPKNEPDPLKMRENTVRLGKIKRRMVIDGKNIEKSVEFSA